MKVYELIEYLEGLPQLAKVTISNYGCGCIVYHELDKWRLEFNLKEFALNINVEDN